MQNRVNATFLFDVSSLHPLWLLACSASYGHKNQYTENVKTGVLSFFNDSGRLGQGGRTVYFSEAFNKQADINVFMYITRNKNDYKESRKIITHWKWDRQNNMKCLYVSEEWKVKTQTRTTLRKITFSGDLLSDKGPQPNLCPPAPQTLVTPLFPTQNFYRDIWHVMSDATPTLCDSHENFLDVGYSLQVHNWHNVVVKYLINLSTTPHVLVGLHLGWVEPT
jgi:hypothetical protein